MGMSDIRVRRSRLLRATPRRQPDAGTWFGSQIAHDRQTVREPDVRMSRRYGTAAPRGSSINQTDSETREPIRNGISSFATRVGRLVWFVPARPIDRGRSTLG